MAKISLSVITKNEEKTLPLCIESVKGLVDEIVVVDSGSVDRTVEIAKTMGAKVVYNEFKSFAAQQTFAMNLCSNDWVLHLDADEALTPELREEIAALIDVTDCDGFYLYRSNYLFGKKMKHGGLGREKRLRFAKKSKSLYTGQFLHDVLTVDGKTGELKNVFTHVPYLNLAAYFAKSAVYTSKGAEDAHNKGRKFTVTGLIFRPPFTFFKFYILKLGILDGFEGYVWAMLGFYHTFVKYLKLWALQNNK
ncbi:glycosyl transferase [Bacteroidia bacterium]|nr:glycosyl transferase [Bacteroidia bacterium]